MGKLGGVYTVKKAPLSNALSFGNTNCRLVVGLERHSFCISPRRGGELSRCCPEHLCVLKGWRRGVGSSKYFKAVDVIGESDLGDMRRPDVAIPRTRLTLAVLGQCVLVELVSSWNAHHLDNGVLRYVTGRRIRAESRRTLLLVS